MATRHGRLRVAWAVLCGFLLGAATAAGAAGGQRSQGEARPWWHEYTPIATVAPRAEGLDVIRPGAARGVGIFGWYGFWFLDSQRQTRLLERGEENLRRAGVRRIIYYDLGEVGDYAGFFTPDGKLAHTGWSLPWWKGEPPLVARWFGLEAFMQNVPWAPFPSEKAYGLRPMTAPDGGPADDPYAVLSRRGLDGRWSFDYSSNARITDELAKRSGLAAISARQSGPADTQGKTGWQTVRLAHLDYANPQIGDYVCREIAHLIRELRPDGIHADNFGDNNLGHANTSAFGLWSLATFRDYLRGQFSRDELQRMGVGDVAAFDLPAYLRDKPWESRGKPWHILNKKWTEDPVWMAYCVHKVRSSQQYHRRFYAAAKEAARRENLPCAVFGNTIPLALGGALMKGACDVSHFEWSTVHGFWGTRPMGLPPKGRVGYVTRLGAAISDAPFCWPSVYVSKDLSGAGHENLHKALAFDCLANRGLLDFGHAYLDGYSPGTAESAGFVNRFVRVRAGRLGGRRYLADVAVVHSAWSEIASMNVFNPIMDRFVDEYCGWCDFLVQTHRQWDVVLEQDLTAERLTRYPIVVLPSVLVLSEAQIEELRRYVAAGGRLVATGLTGTRQGPERNLARRERGLDLSGARMTEERPGVTYWRKDREAASAGRMGELLDWPGLAPRIETDAPATVGVNLNLADDPATGLTLDLNNCDLDVATDTLRGAPAVTTTIRLPNGWRAGDFEAFQVTPEMKADEAVRPLDVGAADGTGHTLIVRTPPFETYLMVVIQHRKTRE